ncbi:hypothetical protein [Salinibaculum rarum]|uniref:hypothetical protein n=1 Tax=Salinibaculum rarum TaxID=3058903 RepID=UPI00265D6A09|nr:hypothetical protein [Salinibaculum sp. KK48]
MTREAARTGFEQFVEDAIEVTAQQFSVPRALRQGVRGPGGKVVDQLLQDSETLWRRVVQPELDDYRDQILTQFDIVLDYAESDAEIEAYRDDLLAVDSYATALREDIGAEQRATMHDRLLARQQGLGDAVTPVVDAEETDFWDAAATVFDREQATALVEDHFAFTTPLRDHRDAFRMQTQFDPGDILGGLGSLLGGGLPTVEVEYTDEALRSMRRAEKTVIAETKRELDRRF